MITDAVLLSPLEQLLVAMGKQEGVYIKQAKPKTNQEVSEAVATVINYVITDAFNLSVEESLWFGQTLKQILKPISALRPEMYLAAVVTELEESRYSEQLISRTELPHAGLPVFSNARQATVTEWSEMMSEIVITCYPDLRASLQSQVIGAIHFSLQSIGLTDDINTTRKSSYLPIAVRDMLGIKS